MHARYARAVVAGTSVVMIFCSVGAAAVEMRHDVSLRAVVRFFSRSHLKEADLSRLVQNPETIHRLEALYSQELGINPGGIVYAREDVLSFHLYPTQRTEAARQDHLENQRIYPNLVRHYFASDLEALLGEMSSPPASARLRRDGLDPVHIFELRRRPVETLQATERKRLLRRAARYIHRFTPFDTEPYELSFADKLRFYEEQRPIGSLVGTFSVDGSEFSSLFDGSYAQGSNNRNHHLAIVHVGPGQFVLTDYYRGKKREYRLRSYRYPIG